MPIEGGESPTSWPPAFVPLPDPSGGTAKTSRATGASSFRIEPSGTRRFSTPCTLSLLTRPFQAQLSSDQRVEHPLRQKQRQSPVLEAFWNYSVACLGSPGGQCDMHSFAQAFWF